MRISELRRILSKLETAYVAMQDVGDEFKTVNKRADGSWHGRDTRAAALVRDAHDIVGRVVQGLRERKARYDEASKGWDV